jgi:hypothetical protein
VEKEVFIKNQEISKIRSEMPIPAAQLEQENKKLLRRLVRPNERKVEQEFRGSR